MTVEITVSNEKSIKEDGIGNCNDDVVGGSGADSGADDGGRRAFSGRCLNMERLITRCRKRRVGFGTSD